jgi:hypothetical protein
LLHASAIVKLEEELLGLARKVWKYLKGRCNKGRRMLVPHRACCPSSRIRAAVGS